MNWQQQAYNKQLEWLKTMASHPGFKAHAWHSANALAQDWPEMFAELPEQLKQAMQQKSSGEPPSSGN